MSVFKINDSNIEIAFLKYKKYIYLLLIVTTIAALGGIFLTALNLGLIFNKNVSDVTIKNEFQNNDKLSLLTNNEFKLSKDQNRVRVNKSAKGTSMISIVNQDFETIAITQHFDNKSEIELSNKSTIITLISNSPQFYFLNNDNKVELKQILSSLDLTNITDYLSKNKLSTLITSKEYEETLLNLHDNIKIQDLITKNYSSSLKDKTSLPGYLNTNKTYPFSFQMNNYKADSANKFKELTGLNVVNNNFSPKLENFSTFHQNLELVNTLSFDEYKLNKSNIISFHSKSVYKPTYIKPSESIDIKLLEDFTLPQDFPEVLSDYKILSKQIQPINSANHAFAYNFEAYLSSVLGLYNSNTFQRVNEDYTPILNKHINTCYDEVYKGSLNCLIDKVKIEIESRFKFENNQSHKIFLNQISSIFVNGSIIKTKFTAKDTSSPYASALFFLRNSTSIDGQIKLKPKFGSLLSKFDNSEITYDGSYELFNQELNESKTNLSFNKNNFQIFVEYTKSISDKYYCTNELDLIKVNNTLYRTLKPKWDQTKVEFMPNQVVYFKTDDKYISNLKVDKPSGLIEVPLVEANLYKNCFTSTNLSTKFNGSNLSILITKTDTSPLVEFDISQVDKFIDSIQINKK